MYINNYSDCFRCPYGVSCCTFVWPWSLFLYVGDCEGRPRVKDNIGTICFEPSPCDVSEGICIGNRTVQCSSLPFFHTVRTWQSRTHFWFICFEILYCICCIIWLWKVLHLSTIKSTWIMIKTTNTYFAKHFNFVCLHMKQQFVFNLVMWFRFTLHIWIFEKMQLKRRILKLCVYSSWNKDLINKFISFLKLYFFIADMWWLWKGFTIRLWLSWN